MCLHNSDSNTAVIEPEVTQVNGVERRFVSLESAPMGGGFIYTLRSDDSVIHGDFANGEFNNHGASGFYRDGADVVGAYEAGHLVELLAPAPGRNRAGESKSVPSVSFRFFVSKKADEEGEIYVLLVGSDGINRYVRLGRDGAVKITGQNNILPKLLPGIGYYELT